MFGYLSRRAISKNRSGVGWLGSHKDDRLAKATRQLDFLENEPVMKALRSLVGICSSQLVCNTVLRQGIRTWNSRTLDRKAGKD